MLNFRLLPLLLAVLVVGAKGSKLKCYKCEGTEGSACAANNTAEMESVECETDRCATARSATLKNTIRACFSGSKVMWDCLLKKFGKSGCVDLAAESTQQDPGLQECLQAGSGNRKKRDAAEFFTYNWCFCEGNHCNSGGKLGANGMLFLGVGSLLALAFA